jgi:hypothetical protein
MSRPAATIIAGPDLPNGIGSLPARFYQDRPGVWITELTYRGTYNALVTFANAFKGLKSLSHEAGPFWTLSVKNQGFQATDTQLNPDAQIVTVYELDSTIIEKDIWQLPKVALALDGIADVGTRLRFRADVEALGRGELSTVDPTNPARQIPLNVDAINKLLATKGQSFPSDILSDLLGSFGKGVTSYPLSSFVLRKTQVAPAEANLVPLFYGSNRIWSTRTLVGTESGIPAAINGPIVAFLSQGYWLKNAPKLAQRNDERTGSRIEVVTEWTYADSFSTFTFGQAL